jgi:hypothetical protein
VKKWIVLATLAVALSPAAAGARNVCVESEYGTWVFQKVKSLKKRGSTVPLQGVFLEAGEPGPFHGTAYVRPDGQVLFGVFVHGLLDANESLVQDRSMTMLGDATFTATGEVDYDGDGATDDDLTWTVIDCKTVVLP